MVRHDLPRQLVAALSLVVAVVFVVLYLHRREATSLLLALVTAGLVLRVLSHMYAAQLVLNAPLAWEYARIASTLAVVVLVTRLLHEMLEPRYKGITRAMYSGLTALFVLMLLATAAGALRLCDAYIATDVVVVATMIALFVLSVRGAMSGAFEAKALTANFMVLAGLALYSILGANGMLPWTGEIDYLLLFQFSVGLALILSRRLILFQREVEGFNARLAEQAGQLRELNERLENKVAERTRQLERANRRLREEKISLQITSITDGLTGLYNRTYALDRFEKELGKARRYGKRLSIIMLDLDHFKRVNDSFGHQAGDMVMQRVGALFRHILRESDLAGRYGGEEFLVVLPETDVEEAAQVAERIRSEVEAFSWPGVDIRVTVSGGVAQFAGDTADQLLQRADYLLYRAKEGGRNRIIAESVQADVPRGSG
jgi:diguanylate cyclase (GGDEF)-like protein